jgi:hypothetical protein
MGFFHKTMHLTKGIIIQTYKLSEGQNILEINLNGYAKGVYSVRVVNNIINHTKKLIFQ